MRKTLKLSSGAGESGSKKGKRGYGGAYGGVWRSLRFAGARRRRGRFCVGAFGRNPASVTVKMFSYLIYFVKRYIYKFYIFNAICKNNAA
jgi:hypothetical protein